MKHGRPCFLSLVLTLATSGCFDRDQCQPVLWGPVGSWRFVASDGVVMANRLFDGWQNVTSTAPEYEGLDRPWLLVAGKPASYGLRFSTKTTAACDPQWPKVSIDGEGVATRVKRRTVVEGCTSPHFCPEENLYEEVDDVIWDWTPSRPGYSSVDVEWGGYRRTLTMLIAATETSPPFAQIPARCRRVQKLDDETWPRWSPKTGQRWSLEIRPMS